MKRLLSLASAFACLLFSVLCGSCGGEEMSLSNIEKLLCGQTYTAKTLQVGAFTPHSNPLAVQGSCFALGELYTAVIYQGENGAERTRIFVTDIEGNLLRESAEMDLQHANCLTYVEKENRILVSACPPLYNGYYKLDPTTLTITEQGTLPHPFFAMAYDAKTDRYASGRWAGETLDVWNGDLTHHLAKDVEKSNSTSQGLFCNEKELYFVRWNPNEILRYDWNLNFLGRIHLEFDMPVEPEAINVVGGETYITCNLSGVVVVYRITQFSLAEK
jgi:hypothetical protein